MILPPFPACVFPNSVTIRLCDDAGNPEGGFNPVPGSTTTLNASVQDKGQYWDSGRNLTVNKYRISFRADPTNSLSRALRNGDLVLWDGLTLMIVSDPNNRGGLGFLWRADCETVAP